MTRLHAKHLRNARVQSVALIWFTADLFSQGYLWGAPPPAAFENNTTASHASTTSPASATTPSLPGFDTLILADLLFNHSEHTKLIRSIQLTLRKTPESVALVFFTPYRPWLLEKDLAFFDLAKAAGFEVTKTYETVMPEVMFQEDRGDELLRRTVFGYEIRWRKENEVEGT